MSGWQVGDLALCIKQGPWRAVGHSLIAPIGTPPVAGGVYTVVRVMIKGGSLRLGFGPIGSGAYLASRFRKVTPGADIEGFEERRRIPEKVEA